MISVFLSAFNFLNNGCIMVRLTEKNTNKQTNKEQYINLYSKYYF